MDADSGRTLEHWVYKTKRNTRETAAHWGHWKDVTQRWIQ